MGVLGVTTNAQDLGILLLELGVGPAERGDLVGSTPCKVKYMESQYHHLFTLELGQRYLLSRLIRQAKIRGCLSYFRWHSLTSYRLQY
jgi:hypothetical protein